MKFFLFRGDCPNFGDELNDWLLPKIFGNFFDDEERDLFLGIGSIIFNSHPQNSRKIVFGAGFGGYTPLPDLDDTWHFYCVRGPRTATACGLGIEKVAGDAAILVQKFRKTIQPKTIHSSFIPHWQSVGRGHWEQACQLAGVHFIDPRKPVEEVLSDIEASEMVIAEAMHGAIVADALRVPWIPVLPFAEAHRMKWFDWAEALELKLCHYPIWPSSTQEAYVSVTQRHGGRIGRLSGAPRMAVRALDAGFVRLASIGLMSAAKRAPSLSSDVALARAIDRLETSGEHIRRDFARR